jgi:hypothetical protein
LIKTPKNTFKSQISFENLLFSHNFTKSEMVAGEGGCTLGGGKGWHSNDSNLCQTTFPALAFIDERFKPSPFGISPKLPDTF